MMVWVRWKELTAAFTRLSKQPQPVDLCFLCEGTLTEHEKDCPQRKDVK